MLVGYYPPSCVPLCNEVFLNVVLSVELTSHHNINVDVENIIGGAAPCIEEFESDAPAAEEMLDSVACSTVQFSE